MTVYCRGCTRREMDRNYLVSVGVQVFNASDRGERFLARGTAALGAIRGSDYEILFVDDGSKDDSYRKLVGFATSNPRIRLIKFSRNFGHQIAITAGIDYARGDCVVVIDADLQDPPEVIEQMVDKCHEGYDVVYGLRADRAGESRVKLATAALFYRLLKRMTRIEIPVAVGDFRLMSRRAPAPLQRLREKERFV